MCTAYIYACKHGQDAVVGAIPEGENYKGRWTAARSAIRMYDAAAAFDKAEVFFLIHRKLP